MAAKAKRYDEMPVEKWNTRHFKQYLEAEHLRHYGTIYTPKIGHQAEAGLLAQYIGTGARSKKPKPRRVENAVLKDFIDRCFANYTPNAQYAGVAFVFMHEYMGRHLQDADAEFKRKQGEIVVKESEKANIEDDLAWL